MTGFVTEFVGSADTLIQGVSKGGFNAVLAAVNGPAKAAATLAVIIVSLNQFLQVGEMPMNRYISLLLKLLGIIYFGFKWENFDQIVSAVQGGMDYIAVKLLTRSMDHSAVTVQAAIDNIISTLSDRSTQMMAQAGWVGGAALGALVTFLLSIIGCAGSLIIIYSKVMVSLYICVAPLFIACYIFERTQDYFTRWVQGLVAYALYPVVTACTLGMVYSVCKGYIDVHSKDTLQTVSTYEAFVSVAFIMLCVILFIPTIVSNLSGLLNHVTPGMVGAKAWLAAKGLKKGTFKTAKVAASAARWTMSPLKSETPKQPNSDPGKIQARNDRINGNSV